MRIAYIYSGTFDAPRTGGAIIAHNWLEKLADMAKVTHFELRRTVPKVRRSFFKSNLAFIRLLSSDLQQGVILEDFYVHPWLCFFNWHARFIRRRRILVILQRLYVADQSGLLRKVMDAIATALFLYPADQIICLSESLARDARRYTPLKPARCFTVVRPGCDFFCPAKEVPRALAPRTRSSRFRLLCLSNYHRQKGILTLVDATAALLLAHPEFQDRLEVVVAGDTSYDPDYFADVVGAVRSLGLQDTIKLLPWQDRSQLRALFATSDVFVFPTLNEGFGMVLVEAMCFGLPIVASDLPVIREVVGDGQAAVLIRPGNTEALASAIGSLVANDDTRQRMAKASRDRGLSFALSWEQSSRAFCEVVLNGAGTES